MWPMSIRVAKIDFRSSTIQVPWIIVAISCLWSWTQSRENPFICWCQIGSTTYVRCTRVPKGWPCLGPQKRIGLDGPNSLIGQSTLKFSTHIVMIHRIAFLDITRRSTQREIHNWQSHSRDHMHKQSSYTNSFMWFSHRAYVRVRLTYSHLSPI